jgi:hypothetical protein
MRLFFRKGGSANPVIARSFGNAAIASAPVSADLTGPSRDLPGKGLGP